MRKAPRTLRDIIDPAHTALIVIDAQNDFIHSEGFLGRMGTDMSLIQKTVPGVNELIKACRQRGVQVVYVREIVSDRVVLPNFLAVMADLGDFDSYPAEEGTWGAEFYDELVKPEPGEPVIDKPSYDGFEDTDLDITLHSRGIETCLFAGFITNCCVETTARHAFIKGYNSILVADAMATGTVEEHEATLRAFRSFFGKTLRTDELVAEWDATE